MESNSLTVKDVTVLLEALEAWINKDLAGKIVFDLTTSIIRKESGGGVETEATIERKNHEFEEKKNSRKEIAILLQAKLIHMKDSMQIKEVMS